MTAPWTCPVCASANSPEATACVVCRAPRPVASPPPAPEPLVPVVTPNAVPAPAPTTPPAAPASSPTPGGRRVPLWLLVAVVVVGVAVIGLVVALGSGSDDRAASDRSSTAAPPGPSDDTGAAGAPEEPPSTDAPSSTAPTTEPELVLADIAPASLVATASSTLGAAPSEGLSYFPENVLDGDLDTGWSQDGSDGGVDAVGSWLAFDLETPTDVRQVSFINGYVKSDAVYQANARVRDIVISDDAGHQTRATLADDGATQVVDVDLPGASRVTITIGSVYPGSKYPDVVLTEVRLRAEFAR